MRDFVAKISLTALFVLAIFSASAAEKVTFEANSPLTVAVGEAFRVEFALNAKPDGDTFKAPSFEGFDVLAGPAISQGSSVQIVNGSMTKSVSYRRQDFRQETASQGSTDAISRHTGISCCIPFPIRDRR